MIQKLILFSTELADKGVRVNSVNPGVIVTNLHKRAGQTEEQYAKVIKQSYINKNHVIKL